MPVTQVLTSVTEYTVLSHSTAGEESFCMLHLSAVMSRHPEKSSDREDDGHKLSPVGFEDSPRGLTAMFTEEKPTVCPFDGVYKAWN